MVKAKKILEKGRFMIFYAGGKRPPHTGAATLALRTEFYRQRLDRMFKQNPDEAKRLMAVFNIQNIEKVRQGATCIVPVNITYYPIRAKENALSNIALKLKKNIPERLVEEFMTEGTMLLSGVDMDIRFGEALHVRECLSRMAIERDISDPKEIRFDDPIPSVRFMRKEALKIMQRYMSAIYKLTTVNHDHLFASIIKLIPFKKIDADDLRRRVYLAASGNLEEKGIHIHKSLHFDQVHLISDDRYHKFRDFIDLAREKGVVRDNGDCLEKDTAKFDSLFDFHRVRIENPIAVIANEVEPLTALQRYVKRIAWYPGFWLRRMITKRLLAKTVRDFEADYTAYYVDGETKAKDVGKPFLLKGKKRNFGILLVHGYMAAPLEVKELAIYLNKRGWFVYVPRLKGHGTSPDDLAVRTYRDWVASVDEGFALISSLCRDVVAGGFSTGAGLALDLATRVETLKGVFAVSAPLRLQDLSARFAPAVGAWNRLMDRFHLNGGKKEFVENHPENPHINYSRNPISGVWELERLMDALEAKLPTIQIPTLVAQSQGDPVVDPKGSKRIFDLLGTQDKEYLLFNFDRHGILLGDGAHRVHRAIGDFIEQL
jgi:esterase/lipase